jgi:carbon-monoxide dehydrogenase large subunit
VGLPRTWTSTAEKCRNSGPFARPTSRTDVAHLELIHLHSPSPLNPFGVKGVGEGSAIAPPVAIANAVCYALRGFRVELNATPVKAEKIFSLVSN